jgi:hypothetical protein
MTTFTWEHSGFREDIWYPVGIPKQGVFAVCRQFWMWFTAVLFWVTLAGI